MFVTVAIPVLLETQGLLTAAVALPTRVVEAPCAIVIAPVIVGNGFVVISTEVLVAVHPDPLVEIT